MKDHFSDDSTNRTYDDPEQELQLLLHLIEEYLDWSDVSESVKALNFFLTEFFVSKKYRQTDVDFLSEMIMEHTRMLTFFTRLQAQYKNYRDCYLNSKKDLPER